MEKGGTGKEPVARQNPLKSALDGEALRRAHTCRCLLEAGALRRDDRAAIGLGQSAVGANQLAGVLALS